MSYCSIDDIQRLIKWTTFTSSSKITIDDVNNFYIPEADEYIDAKLERIYTVPITNASDIKILKYISCRLAASEISRVLVLQTHGQMPEIVKIWMADAEKRLNQIGQYEIDLPNSTRVEVTEGVYSYTAHGLDDDGDDPPNQEWVIGEEQW